MDKWNGMLLNFEGTVIDQPQQISECFNTFFKNVPLKIISNLNTRNCANNSMNIKNNHHSMFVHEFSEYEIADIIKFT